MVFFKKSGLQANLLSPTVFDNLKHRENPALQPKVSY